MAKGGRPKGSRNKLTRDAKAAIQMVFDKLGGVSAMVAWVEEDKANRFAFYTKIYPRLLPRPAPDAPPAPEELPPVRGALIWEPPTPSPYPPLSAMSSISAVAAALGDEGTKAGGAKPAPT